MKKLKNRLTEIEYRQLIDHSLDAIFMLKEKEIYFVNQAGLDLIGTSDISDVVGKSLNYFIHNDSFKTYQKVIKHEQPELLELKIVNLGGATLNVEVRAMDTQFQGERATLVVMRDITERKKAEELLRNSEKLSAVGEVSAGIAHEVRNPLTAVKGFLQLLQQDTDHQYFEIIFNELDNALSTLNNLLQVSKPDLTDEPTVTIHLCTELESILYLFQDQMYRVQFETELRDTHETIKGKKNLLKKAIFNLIKNSLEAIPDTGKITIKHFVQNETIHISISDTGIGIPKDKLDQLGTPFFSTKNDGTGMGLTQVFATIHDHGGKIFAESVEGEGTTFFIQIPIQKTIEHEVRVMEQLQYFEGQSFIDYLKHNQEHFNELLMVKSKSVFIEVDQDSELVDQDHLLETASKLINYLNNGEDSEHAMILLAKKRSIDWAKSNLPLILKLEFLQNFRMIYWDFIYNYYHHVEANKEEFFRVERKVNSLLDTFIKHYFSSYTNYRNEVLKSHQDTIEELTIPLISLSSVAALLPLVGTIDTHRAKRIQERTIQRISELKLRRVFIDLSGVPYIDTAVIGHLFRLVDGMEIMGCNVIVTGVRPEIVNTIIDLGIKFNEKVLTSGTLEQAIEEYGLGLNQPVVQ